MWSYNLPAVGFRAGCQQNIHRISSKYPQDRVILTSLRAFGLMAPAWKVGPGFCRCVAVDSRRYSLVQGLRDRDGPSSVSLFSPRGAPHGDGVDVARVISGIFAARRFFSARTVKGTCLGLTYWKRRRPADDTTVPMRERYCAVPPGSRCRRPRTDSRWQS